MAPRVGRRRVKVVGETLRAAYLRAYEVCERSASPVKRALRGEPGDEAFSEDVAALLQRSPRRRRPVGVVACADRALTAFLQVSGGTSLETRALRAMTLDMLQHHAPRFFVRHALGPALEAALDRLTAPIEWSPASPHTLTMAWLDAAYALKRHHRPPMALPSVEVLTKHLEALLEKEGQMWPWLMAATARGLGLPIGLRFPVRPYRGEMREADVYWLTHELLLMCDFFAVPLRPDGLESRAEELFLAVPWLLSQDLLDVAAEVAWCLQLLGEDESFEHAAILRALRLRQASDGSVQERPRGDQSVAAGVEHTTALALLAFAGAAERAPKR